VTPAQPPSVSVIIAAYNWSNALRCSIASVLLQSFTDFELLVVGDGCTDDSGRVALSFGDSRIKWINLPFNTGGQGAPNNYGILHSSGEYIAYLGQDDIWFPTHLESLTGTIARTGADVAGAVAILYGPPGSGVTGATGVFASGDYSERDMLVPSSILHRRSLVSTIGLWAEDSAIPLPVDVDFEKRACAAGAKIVSSGELTVFKFNAAWRRNSYIGRAATEQEEMLARIQTGIDFRATELIAVVRSFLGGKYVPIESPAHGVPGEAARYNSRYKGTSREVVVPRHIEERERFFLDDQLAGFEWHAVEHHEKWGSLRWSGPCQTSTLEFPLLWDQALAIRIHILWHVQRSLPDDVELLVNGEAVHVFVEATEEGTTMLGVVLAAPVAGVSSERGLQLSLHVARTQQPPAPTDRRWLGVAVNWIEFSPLSAG
jgi:glycosyltransferase involved in cell wall biosynthesis